MSAGLCRGAFTG